MTERRQEREDEELRKQLHRLGEEVGPITDSTRSLYQRRLSRLNGTRARTPPRRSPPSYLGHLSSDDSDGSVDVTKRGSRRKSAPPRRRATPEKSRHSEPLLLDRPSLRSRVGHSLFSDDFSDTDVEVPSPPTLHEQRHNQSLLVHRADESGRSNGFTACVEQPRYQWVSLLLLLAAALFFLFLGAAYLGVRYPTQPGSKEKRLPKAVAPYNATLCEEHRQKPCLWEANVPAALQLSGRIQRLLGDVAGKFECGEASRRNLSYSECLKLLLGNSNTLLTDSKFQDSLLLLFENPAWGIMLLGKDGLPMTEYEEGSVVALEAKQAVKSYWCCLLLSLHGTATFLAWCVLLPVSGCAVYFLLCWYKARRDQKRNELFDLVEKVTAIVREHAEQPNCREPYLAQVHVRDMLIPPSERKRQSQLWQQCVSFLEQNESRLQAERRQIEGESYLVWRWVGGSGGGGASPTPRSKVWQGRAFENPASGAPATALPPFVPASCLKIRNMFDPEVEYEVDWPVRIQNAILEKCEGNQGILHLQVDTASKEGCVYMKCASLETAGQAYRALHGSWFDGNLITVKYLRLERYHERFPEAAHCKEPLQPTNSLRLSLDTRGGLEEDAL